MALVACPECETQISDNAKACPHCGSPRKRKPSGAGKLMMWGGLSLVGVFVLFVVVVANDPNSHESEAYKACKQLANQTGALDACEGIRQ